MTEQRRTATAVGIMFIVATGCYMIGQSVYAPIVGSADYLNLVFPQRSRVTVGILVELVGVLAIPLIALLFYPVLRRHHHGSALAYIGIRIMEAVALLLVIALSMATIDMSAAYQVSATGADWQIAGSAIQAVSESAFIISVGVIFPLGALVLNAILWQARLVPRLLSGWGLVGSALLLVGSLLDVLELLPAAPAIVLEGVLAGPIAIQEMALATWLIAKGVATSGPATPQVVR